MKTKKRLFHVIGRLENKVEGNTIYERIKGTVRENPKLWRSDFGLDSSFHNKKVAKARAAELTTDWEPVI